MAMKPNQMALIKAVSMKLNPDTLLIVTEMYHAEKTVPADPNTKAKVDRSKTEYRYEGRVVSIPDLQAEISQMESKPTESWKWPNLPEWNILYCNQDTNSRGAKWLSSKIKKAVSLEDGFKILNGAKRNPHTLQLDTHPSAKYDLTGYVLNNTPFDITLETLATLKPGTTFSKQIKKI